MRDTRTTTPASADAWCRMNEPDADPRGDGEDPGQFRMSDEDGPLVEELRRVLGERRWAR